jgi:hypothetical protein
MSRYLVALAIMTGTGLATVRAEESSARPAPAPALGRTMMFVDDHDVLYRSGTTRVMNPARRHSDTALIGQTRPWEVAIGWVSVYRDPKTGKYQLWYQAYAGKRAGDKRLECVVCYAESDDGLTFTKPDLDLFPFKDHAKTNIVLIGTGGYGDRYCNSVLVDPVEREPDPARRYKMAYYDWVPVAREGREYPGLCVAFSPDGVHWTKHPHPEGPLYKTSYGARGVPPPFADEDPYRETPVKDRPVRKTWFYPLVMADAVDVSFDPRRAEYVIYAKMWMDAPDGGAAWKHGMGRIASKDFLTWEKPEFILGPDDQDRLDAEFHTSPVFFYNERYVCLNQMLDRKAAGAIDIELMTSRDGYAWDRNFRDRPFLGRSQSGLFDSRAIFTNATPVILDDEIRFYYGAYNQSPVGGVKSEPGQRSGVGLARIPRDRFAGLRSVDRSDQKTLKKPLEKVGQVTLKPLDLTGCREIDVNADAAAGEGAVRVELLTEEGFRVRGYARDDAVPIEGDSLRHQVAWKERRLDELPAGRYLLRIHLKDATLYAISYR